MTSRVVIGGIAAAAVIAGTTGAVALAGPSGSPAPRSSTPTSTAGPGKTAGPGVAVDPNVARVAAQLGVPADRLLHALAKAKMAAAAGGSPTGDAAARAVAADLGVSQAQAQRALRAFFGAGATRSDQKPAPPVTPEAILTALASRLHVSTARAAQVLNALDRMSNPGHGIDPASPAFAALAHSLGKTPAQLDQILRAWKESLRATMPQSPSPRPATPTPKAS